MSSLDDDVVEEYNGPWENVTGQIVQIDEYFIDYGGFSEVYRGKWKNDVENGVEGEILAIKTFRGVHTKPEIKEKITRRVKRESKVWHSLEHPNILRFYGICTDIGPGPVLISLYCKNGNAGVYLESNDDVDRLSMLRGILEGLKYLHSHDVVHGDIKISNVLISDEGAPLICDFGRSLILLQTGFTTEFSATPRYTAPELIKPYGDGEEELMFDPKPTKATDVYSFGMVCIDVITGKPPYWYIKHNSAVITTIGRLIPLDRSRYESTPLLDQFWPLLEECWTHVPGSRPSIEQVLQTVSSY